MNKKKFYSENKKAKGIQTNLNKITSDQQTLNLAGFSANEHMRELAQDHEIGDGMQKQMFRNLGILAEIFPEKAKLDEADDMNGKYKTWTPEQLRDIKDALYAIEEPDEVVLDIMLERRPVSVRQMKVLRRAHAEFIHKLKIETLVGINSGQIHLSYRQKIMLSNLFNMPMKSIMAGEAQMTVDRIWQQEAARRQHLIQRGGALPDIVDVQDAAAARAESIRG